jgi:cysteine desulfurase
MCATIYLDHQATTPVDPRVFEVMVPYFTERFGNAASRTHSFGWDAADAVERARAQVASAIGASPKEIVFTSGATEANNLAIKGVAEAAREAGRGSHIVTVCTEHKAVLDTCTALERRGFTVTRLPVDSQGLIKPEQVEEALTPETVLVSVMHANNEIGVIQPIREIGGLCRDRGVLFHTDAAQSVGKIPLNVSDDLSDLVSLSGHKVYGPKGIGALYVRRARPRLTLKAQLHGGGHERGFRSGTLPVPLIVGLGEALEVALREQSEEATRLERLRQRLLEGLREVLSDIHLNGHPTQRLPGNLNVSFAYVEGEALLMALGDIAVSSGSACTSASMEPSYVLQALGLSDELCYSSVRFGLGRRTTSEEIEITITKVVEVVHKLRALSPLWQMVQRGEDPSSVDWAKTG